MENTVMAPPRFTTRVGESEQTSGWAFALTVVLHALGAAAIVIVPLLGEESLPLENTSVARAFFVAPALAPVPPPPPPPAAARTAAAPRATPTPTAGAFTAPIEVPDTIVPEAGMDLGRRGRHAGRGRGWRARRGRGRRRGRPRLGSSPADAGRPGRRRHPRAEEGEARPAGLPEHRDRREGRGRRDPGVHDQPPGPGRRVCRSSAAFRHWTTRRSTR